MAERLKKKGKKNIERQDKAVSEAAWSCGSKLKMWQAFTLGLIKTMTS